MDAYVVVARSDITTLRRESSVIGIHFVCARRNNGVPGESAHAHEENATCNKNCADALPNKPVAIEEISDILLSTFGPEPKTT